MDSKKNDAIKLKQKIKTRSAESRIIIFGKEDRDTKLLKMTELSEQYIEILKSLATFYNAPVSNDDSRQEKDRKMNMYNFSLFCLYQIKEVASMCVDYFVEKIKFDFNKGNVNVIVDYAVEHDVDLLYDGESLKQINKKLQFIELTEKGIDMVGRLLKNNTKK